MSSLPGTQLRQPDRHNFIRLQSNQAKVLVCALGLLVFLVDMEVPADLDIAIFYCFVIVLCVWTRSRVYLWSATTIFALVTFPGLLLSPAPVTGPITWVNWANRLFGIGALVLVAGFLHFQMRNFRLLENTVSARRKAEAELKESEARLRIAQAAGRIGSWQWMPWESKYTWSEECYDIFGIDRGEKRFVEKWRSAVDAQDLGVVDGAVASWDERDSFELDYRYQHPTRGLRWIHTRGRVLRHDPAGNCWFGICHDITERKQTELLLHQSQSMLEAKVEERTAELRKLSAQLLQLQDEERRRIARELHDSLGQYLASLKINLDQLAGAGSSLELQRAHDAHLLSDCVEMVQQCIVETRTLSHLLHPPLLDEVGFASAARWYVEEFMRRSHIEARLELPSNVPRLPSAIELALFRILQESLTNVHRYSHSSAVDVELAIEPKNVVLTVRDYGRGIPEELVKEFREHGTGAGVGLSGMRERVKELGGQLELSSDAHGTTLRASIPVSISNSKRADSTTVTAASAWDELGSSSSNPDFEIGKAV